jgi:hypothetical protein
MGREEDDINFLLAANHLPSSVFSDEVMKDVDMIL